MERINVEHTPIDLIKLLERVSSEGTPVELERNGKIIARIVPVTSVEEAKSITLSELLASLPSLGDDAEAFAKDVLSARDYLI